MRTKPIGSLVLIVILALAACGGDDASSSTTTTMPSPESTTTATTAAPTTTEDPTAAVEQAFYDQWDAFVEITGHPDVRNPLIDRYFAGKAKEALSWTGSHG